MKDMNTQVKEIASHYGVESVMDALRELYLEHGRELEDGNAFKTAAQNNAKVLMEAQTHLKTCW